VAIFGDSLSEETWGPLLSLNINNDTSISSEFQIVDFAKGGTTAGPVPEQFQHSPEKWGQYIKEPKFHAGLDYKPDIAIFMIGKNDAKEVFWKP